MNEALNDLYIREDDIDSLQRSVRAMKNFNLVALAQRLEKQDRLDYRRLSIELYKDAKKFEYAVTIAKEDKLYRDAIDCVAASKVCGLNKKPAKR